MGQTSKTTKRKKRKYFYMELDAIGWMGIDNYKCMIKKTTSRTRMFVSEKNVKKKKGKRNVDDLFYDDTHMVSEVPHALRFDDTFASWSPPYVLTVFDHYISC